MPLYVRRCCPFDLAESALRADDLGVLNGRREDEGTMTTPGNPLTDQSGRSVQQLATDIVVAYLATGTVDPTRLPDLVRQVRTALSESDDGMSVHSRGAAGVEPVVDEQKDQPMLGARAKVVKVETPEAVFLTPAGPIDQSVFPDYLVSLEDGARYRSLKRHLRVKYDMTPEDYRAKWGLPDSYPMVAPDYARERSEVAKRIGLGKRHAPAETPRRARGRVA